MTATRLPYLVQKIETVCGVSAISGTSIMTCSPLSKTSSIIFIMTLVLPEPVTPKRSAHFALPLSLSEESVSYAFICAVERWMGVRQGVSPKCA